MFKYPLHKRLQNLTKNRLKRTSLNHVLKEQQRKQSDILVPRPEECEMLTHNRTPLVLKAEVKYSIPGISTKSSDSEASLKTLTLAELDKSYPATAWTQVFTDGSAENATRNGGYGSTSTEEEDINSCMLVMILYVCCITTSDCSFNNHDF